MMQNFFKDSFVAACGIGLIILIVEEVIGKIAEKKIKNYLQKKD
jgi:hypothetical protein